MQNITNNISQAGLTCHWAAGDGCAIEMKTNSAQMMAYGENHTKRSRALVAAAQDLTCRIVISTG
jgi:hypothetical protein